MDVASLVSFDKQHNFFACIFHRYALLPGKVHNHFQDHHRSEATPADRRALQAHVDQICSEQNVKTEYSDFIVTDLETIAPFASLELHKHSHQCRHCLFITTGVSASSNMKAHLRKMHLLFNPNGTQKQEGTLWYDEQVSVVTSQRFFTTVPKANSDLGVTRFFRVTETADTLSARDSHISTIRYQADPAPHDSNLDASIDHEITRPERSHGEKSTVEELLVQLESAATWAKQHESTRLGQIPDVPAIQMNPWLAHTRFLEIISKFGSWAEALDIIRIPKEQEEPMLFYLYCNIKSMVRTWQNVTIRTSRYTRIRVMQEHALDVPLFPLEVYQNFDLRHTTCLQKVFMFFSRYTPSTQTTVGTLLLQQNQLNSWEALQAHLEDPETMYSTIQENHDRILLSKTENLCHRFWMSLIEQTSRTDDLELALVTPIALLSLSPNATGFREVYNIATDLSAFKKFARLASIQSYHDKRAVEEVQTHPIAPDDHTSTRTEEVESLMKEVEQQHQHQVSEECHRSIADEFRRWVHQYLSTEYPTPMNWIINTARYASRFRYGENLDAFVHWNGENVTVRSVKTNLEQLKNAVWNQYEEASALLCQLAYVHQRDELPAIPWDTLEDQASKATVGYSVFTPSNPYLAKDSKFLIKKLLNAVQERTFKKYTISDLTDLMQIKHYCDGVQTFLGHLLCLVHLTSGQPARGTELLSIQVENTAANGIRNIFLFNGLVAMVPRYHKGYNRDKSIKTVYRFLPREVGALLVWYLWLVRPFYILLQHQKADHVQDHHFFRATSSFLWAEADGRQYQVSRPLSLVMRRATLRWMGQEINISTLRHLLIAFGRKIDTNGGLPKELSKEDVDDIIDEAEAEAREMQAGHSAETAHTVYALDISKVFAQKQHLAEAHFKTSTQWHKALQFPTHGAEESRKMDHEKQTLSSALASRLNINLKALLRENFGDQACFRGKQEEVLRSIMTGNTVVAYVAGTGHGKSLMFLLPACFPDYGQTIVIVPLAALRTDIIKTCERLRVRTSTWKQGHCDETAAIILATPESIGSQAFVAFAKRLSASGRLERIVVDEFHYVLLSDGRFRPHLMNLGAIAQYGTRITLLSATVPHELQRQAFRLLGLPSDTIAYREPTVRPNISYQVHTLPQQTSVTGNDMVNYVQTQQTIFNKILVYVDSKDMVNLISSELGCDRYHADMPESEKQNTQEKFYQARSGTFIATSAFTAGVHTPYLPAVLRFGLPDNLINWAQESGRGGRDGSPCVARLILARGIRNTHFDKADRSQQEAILSFAQPNQKPAKCRRKKLDEYFDNNTTRQMCKQEENKCDVCSSRFYPGTYHKYVQIIEEDTNNADHGPGGTSNQYPNSAIANGNGTNQQYHMQTPTINAMHNTPPTYTMYSPLSTTHRVPTNEIRNEIPTTPNISLLSSPVPSTQKRSFDTTMNDKHDDPSSPIVRYKLARQNRELNFNTSRLGYAASDRARVFINELPETQSFWSTHCVICFANKRAFNHTRSMCTESIYIGSLVGMYRKTMDNKWGQGQCWYCLMPANCCPRWNIDGTGRTRNRPRTDVECTDKYTIRDTWAYIWENCPKARTKWIQHVQETDNPDWQPGHPSNYTTDFKKHFQSVIHFGEDYKAGNICVGLNWLTQTFFLGDDLEAFKMIQ